jgi:hypothetical protein
MRRRHKEIVAEADVRDVIEKHAIPDGHAVVAGMPAQHAHGDRIVVKVAGLDRPGQVARPIDPADA